jgi:GR25 family glycosyltransferase involved in LPS biosynthesis
MASLNEVVDQVYVINMDKDVERMKKFDEQMVHNRIRYKRISAIKGTDIKENKHMTEFCKIYCTDGIKGCALSHRLIWDDMVKNNYSRVCVFEDDALLTETFRADFPEIWKELPTTFDLFFMGCNMKCGDKHAFSKLIVLAEGNEPAKHISPSMLKVGGTVGTHGYIISRHCAELFLGETFNTHIDFEMSRWISKYNLEAYSPHPKLVDITGAESNLADNYPYIINSILQDIPISDSSTLEWAASENSFKIASFNINGIIVYTSIMILLFPASFYIILVVWLLLEFAVSFDYKNTFRYAVILSAVAGIKHGAIYYLYPFILKQLRR